MACFNPRQAWFKSAPNPETGKHQLTFKRSEGALDTEILMHCGQCIGCRSDNQKQLALRSMHEAAMHEENTFFTFTLNDENLPEDRSVSPELATKSIRRIRDLIKENYPENEPIKYLIVGEYGSHPDPITGHLDLLGRPHYHGHLFGFDPPDKYPVATSSNGETLYGSDFLENAWGKGHIQIGDVAYGSALYTAGYCLKKINGDLKDKHYEWQHLETGETYNRRPEFQRASNRPGLGASWFDQFHSDLDKGFFHVRGTRMPVPPYYLVLASRMDDQTTYESLREVQRINATGLENPEKHQDRLRVKERIRRKRQKHPATL